MTSYFITGTGTDVGKTVVTTLLAEYLGNGYIPFKPIETGTIERNGVRMAIDPEVYRLVKPFNKEALHSYLFKKSSSPHLAAKAEHTDIDMGQIKQDIAQLQQRYTGVIVEGAGGLYVPIHQDGYSMIDFMAELQFPVILVGIAGLGTINHTVLSIEALKAKQLPIAGIILTSAGKEDPIIEKDNVMMIHTLTGIPVIGTVPYVREMNFYLNDKAKRSILTANWDRQYLFNREEVANESGPVITN